MLELHVHLIKDQYRLVTMELEMLQEQQKIKEQQNSMQVDVDSRTKKDITQEDDLRLQTVQNGPLLSKNGKLLRNFVLVSKRDELKSQVFRPGHNLPTMSIEEYLDREMERGNFLSGGTDPKEKIPGDDDESVDAATYKARQWDAFRDDNPRGWGNRHNKG
jgi:immunoglobulin-binding protein 1